MLPLRGKHIYVCKINIGGWQRRFYHNLAELTERHILRFTQFS